MAFKDFRLRGYTGITASDDRSLQSMIAVKAGVTLRSMAQLNALLMLAKSVQDGQRGQPGKEEMPSVAT